ncbi:hypothetical protein [Pseudalkalibacillus salsuginis]|uniref:hypothetical protein n=1 Tax=Pseudalkalibacillus salsuginis TaxID=2910972 RepID=UPI001F33CDC1|nr:hypothetical protein [Pseudalkalibacillus salsuginis]MCF6411206.1 hypothetical protein [Pseudalkalibacillus salsuginis]
MRKKNSETPRPDHDQEVIRAMTDKEIEAFHRKTYEKYFREAKQRKSTRRK